MDTELVSFAFYLFVFVGAVIAFKDRSRTDKLMKKVTHLQKIIDFQTVQIDKLKQALNESASAPLSTDYPAAQIESIESNTVQTDNLEQPQLSTPAKPDVKSSPKQTIQKQFTLPEFNLDTLLKGNGIFWLGAFVLSIGGVFLARYSIESGLLPPAARVILGALFGCALITGAELVNRFKTKLNVNTPYISAALASGGVITCFAMVLVSFNHYHFLPANLAFVFLAVIALCATYLALRFGPVLAGIGIIGAYAVPALVSTGSNNIGALLLYVAFVSLSAVWVADYVKQKWLWWQSFVGHCIWFIGAIVLGDKGDFAAITLYTVATLYFYVISNLLGWRLNLTMHNPLPIKSLLMARKEQVATLITLFLFAIYLMFSPVLSHMVAAAFIVATIAFASAYRHSALDTWPYLALCFALFMFGTMHQKVDFNDILYPFTGKYLFIQIAALFGTAFSVLMIKRDAARHAYLLLLVLVPLSLFGFSYISLPMDSDATLYPVWAFELLLIAAGAALAAAKSSISLQRVTYLVLANAMLTLCLTMLLSASTLTLAVAAQVASMSYLSWKYKVKIPDWLYKAALLVVVTRLSVAPWAADYKHEAILSIHWTLIVYPIAIALVWFSAKYNPSRVLNTWFMGVFIHLCALFVTTETSYLLVGDYPNFDNLSYREGVVLSLNWLILAGVYYWRSQLTHNLQKLYKIGGSILVGASTLMHVQFSVFESPFVHSQNVGGFFINWLWIQWLTPILCLYGFIHFKLVQAQFNRFIYIAMAIFGFMFVNGEIRTLYNNGFINWHLEIKEAELYTYSIVWLLISTTTIFVAQHFNHKQLINIGFIGLAMVIFKAFMVDMSNLEGLLRALSFIGLGLCLVGVGWLFQKMQPKSVTSVPDKKV
ncbi:DUF2339 domain-containing protein [Pseudoalteromonas luteoviolacea]|uniref:DUF2339 domain-containing protein n=1 Tax=Pseudoalteromonas luteoviolacea S4054 TaxID=1129367 RepID=A0A0F6ADR6_9GAMM|nr:DUF2339 domain-containing protein [Pseudoalteromonas luteoviolacea]AOT08099.1 hypothetical protein S4054249_09665 [Pseudoalteromonas luteoviolacea]AOT13016.1 hypothetical protein S40542_09665 [Pseudoalteromonas luteoviolacea]AOT17928.1 hypothetical protein S4054_09660 [Pseudoalteromonas luteoviolacea]KKE84352.1 hypothetical protein N479_08900 [Pseudoalteromonas luteoviolacea S4054]KZN71727.1 hypothetical protein N481_17440 [Pseudoalteromonas luteoviolacea S4047-1]